MYLIRRSFGVLLLFAFFTIFTSACAYKGIKHGTEITDEEVSKIVDGQTTKEEILIAFGDPSKILNNERAFFYSWTRGSK
jgi:outer membrane protein assembly factor BamE (lipoprotein component of BamABCDE complex)